MTVQISSFERKQVGVKGFVSEARIARRLDTCNHNRSEGGAYWGWKQRKPPSHRKVRGTRSNGEINSGGA